MNVPGSGPSSHSQSNRTVVRQSSLTGIAAAAGILAGLVLDFSIAIRFGASARTDEFFVAARIPLGLVAVVMVAANQALVPAFRTSATRRGERPTDRLISMVLCTVIVVGAFLVVVSALVAAPLVHVTAPGFSPSEVQKAAFMVPIMFATVPLVAIAEVLRAYLNARYAFVAPALMTVVLNGLAAAVILAGPLVNGGLVHDIHVVAFAFLAGAVAQAVFMALMAGRQGMRVRPALDLRDEHLRGIGKLCIRPLGSAGLNPIARLAEQALVSPLPEGSISILNYGYLIVSAVGGTVFFRSVIVALIPRLTDAHARDEQDEVRRFTALGMRIMLAISLPLTAFMAVLASPAVLAVFQRGQFARTSAVLLGTVLAVYSISLVPSAVQRALLAPFFARLDTRVPLRNTVYGVVANLVLLPLLMLVFGFGTERAIIGVALAYSVSQFVNVGHAWYRLSRLGGAPGRDLVPFTLKIVVASVLSGTAMIAASFALDLNGSLDRTQLLIRTPLAGLVGLGVLAAAMLLFNGHEIASWRALLRRGPRSALPAHAVAPETADADVALMVEDGVDVEAIVDLESTAITTNLP
ncbi:MAG: murein biosynthesis integral membrane protein MurJ [Candidatus Dormibacteria bacterium]